MKLLKGLLVTTAAVSALSFSINAVAADSDSATFNITATVLADLAVTNTSALSFGDTVASASTQNVTVAAGDSGAAVFSISGPASQAMNLSVTGPVTLQCTNGTGACVNGTDTMSVNTFTYGGDATSSGSNTGTVTTSTGGTASVRTGATLAVGANQATGDYTGTGTLSVSYS